MSTKVFEGIKIAEFAWVVAGPTTSRYFADHGATVIRIESHKPFDLLRGSAPFAEKRPGLNRSMFFGKYNANKYSVSLNLYHPKGQDIARRLIQWSDIVTESFRPGTMKKLGLDYESVSKFKPDIIYFSTSMQGQTGPFAHYAGLGSQIAAIVGIGEISGWPDRIPSPPYGAYTDYFCPRINSTALIAALDYRRRTGKGQWIEQSHLETAIHLLAPLVMDYSTNGRIAERDGNRLPDAAPHGVYPCKGEDKWVAITVFNNDQWESFCEAIGNPQWAKSENFETLDARKENEDELDNHIAYWTANHSAEQVETAMQEAGVCASVVNKSSDLFEDAQLKHRQFYTRLNHAEMGNPAYQQQVNFILSKTPREVTMPSPCLGEHNVFVFKELLGMTDDEIADHIAEGIITIA